MKLILKEWRKNSWEFRSKKNKKKTKIRTLKYTKWKKKNRRSQCDLASGNPISNKSSWNRQKSEEVALPRRKRAGKKVKERCARHNKDRHELIPLVSRRHQVQKTGSPVLIGFLNVRSLNNKVEDMVELIQDYKMDMMFMAVTCHDPESIIISKLQSRGLVVFEKIRPRLPESVKTLLTNHGGVTVAFNSMFRGFMLKLSSTASFEHMCVTMSSSSNSIIGLVVYRTSAASSLFYKEFGNTGILAAYNEEVWILGNFIFHLKQSNNTDAQTFLNILRSHGFDSSTKQPTHYQGGWLDVIASRKSININYIDSGIFDHMLLLCSFEMLKPPLIYRQLQIRRGNFFGIWKVCFRTKAASAFSCHKSWCGLSFWPI